MRFCRNLGHLSYANSFFAELQAVVTVVEVIISLDISQAIIESDSLEVIQILNKIVDEEHRYAEVLQHVARLQLDHGGLQFQHAHREANNFADYIAHVGFRFPLLPKCFTPPFGECHQLIRLDSGEASSSSTSSV